MLYWRTATGEEVDLVIETSSRTIPIEVKTATRLGPADARGLESFLDEYAGITDGAYYCMRVLQRKARVTPSPLGRRHDNFLEGLLLHRVPECLSVTPDAIIAGNEGNQLGRLADFCRRGQVNRIERVDGLDGVGASRAHQD